MSSILDIDLDYFNLIKNPEQRFYKLLHWGNYPIAFFVEKHHRAYSRWKAYIKRGELTTPSHILHVDEHHDMMDERRNLNIANFMYHTMQTWKDCRVHWLVGLPIDSPDMWLEDDVWESFSPRFSVGSTLPHDWPKPDMVSICTSSDFISNDLLQRLMKTAKSFMSEKQRTDMQPNSRPIDYPSSLSSHHSL